MESAELDYVQVIAAAAVPAGERIVFEIDGEPIALFHVSGQFYAIGDICTHDNGPLAEGELRSVHNRSQAPAQIIVVQAPNRQSAS